ncbi:MAG: hypothetical protein ACUVRX_02480 [Actinomycetota bacterium]
MTGKEILEAGPCLEAGKRSNPLLMFARFAAFGAAAVQAARGMVAERRHRHLLAWMGGWVLFLTWPRYLICSRCEGYGEMCRSYYLGKYTSLLFPRVEGKEVGKLAVALEALSLSTIFWVPALALRKNRKEQARYLSLVKVVLLGQFFHACRWCGTRAEPGWKRVCPAYRFWRSKAS